MMKDYKHMRLTEELVVSPEDSLKVELKYYCMTVVLIAILCIDKI